MIKFLKLLVAFSLVLVASCQNSPGSGNGSVNETVKTGKKGKSPASSNYNKEEDNAGLGTGNDNVIDRHPGHLIYTKHARCRMGCRHIDESEVTEILEKGRVNYAKSEPNGHP